MTYKIPEWQLPTELQHYAKGTADFPSGKFTKQQVKSARKYRQTFFRRLQAYRPGLQYQWQDYQSLMWEEIATYVKRILRDKVMKIWDDLAGHNSRLRILFRTEYHRRFQKSGPMSLARRERIIKEIKEQTLMRAAADPRTLGLIEEVVLGKAFYGIPTRPQHIDWPR